MKTNDSANRSLRLSTDEVDHLLDELDAKPRDPNSTDRDQQRYQLRTNNCLIALQQPGAGLPTTFVVSTRNLSAGGMAFLHGGFVHEGSTCQVCLATLEGEWHQIESSVVRCRYLKQMIHEVSVQFGEKIDPDVYCHADDDDDEA